MICSAWSSVRDSTPSPMNRNLAASMRSDAPTCMFSQVARALMRESSGSVARPGAMASRAANTASLLSAGTSDPDMNAPGVSSAETSDDSPSLVQAEPERNRAATASKVGSRVISQNVPGRSIVSHATTLSQDGLAYLPPPGRCEGLRGSAVGPLPSGPSSSGSEILCGEVCGAPIDGDASDQRLSRAPSRWWNGDGSGGSTVLITQNSLPSRSDMTIHQPPVWPTSMSVAPSDSSRATSSSLYARLSGQSGQANQIGSS